MGHPASTTLRVDLNADLGEGVTDDAGLLAVVTSANVACGFHAGDEATMRAVCRLAAARRVVVGAQVSYDDREGFGRRRMDPAHDVLRDDVATQVEVLSRLAAEEGTSVAYLKPHGALYNRVVDDEEQARAVLAGSGDLPVLGLPGSVVLRLAADLGRRTVTEGFPDRGYTPEGRLVPRDRPGALVEDPRAVAANAVRLAGSVESVCVHGDSPGAVEVARGVRAALLEGGDRGARVGVTVRRAGADALLVECDSLEEAMALHAEVRRRAVAVRDLVPGARTVLLDGLDDAVRLAAEIPGWVLPEEPARDGPPVEVPTTYDGPDLADVARLWDMTSDEVVATHLATAFTVAFGGFAPGFGYLAGLGRETPRLGTPRPSVPAGSVGLAGEFSGVYPRASPGGWRLIGRTDLTVWDADREPPALLVPGARVRFVRA